MELPWAGFCKLGQADLAGPCCRGKNWCAPERDSAEGSLVVRMKKLLRRSNFGFFSVPGRCGEALGAGVFPGALRLDRAKAWCLSSVLVLGLVMAGCGESAVDLGAAPEEVESVLFKAIGAGDLETVKAEISRDALLLNQPEGGFVQTPLHKAIRAKQLEIARYLIESGAEVNVFDNLNRTPLAAAMDVEAGAEFIQLLEENGAVD